MNIKEILYNSARYIEEKERDSIEDAFYATELATGLRVIAEVWETAQITAGVMKSKEANQ